MGSAARTKSWTASGSPGPAGAPASAAATEAFAGHEGLDLALLLRRQDVEYGQALAGSFILHRIPQASDFLLHCHDFFLIRFRLQPEQFQFAALAEHLVLLGFDVFQVSFAQCLDLDRLIRA